ncbi:MAG: hypothetical protein HY482_02935 [Candidatus Wildermuthbacteria bacterium]|nr:hypothetical protein [Candidatus Wildermuthbacteria bacterium]
MLTQRQQDILEKVTAEYIKLAQPVSSQLLEETYDFQVSPATIRSDLLALSEQGFLFQPHVSAGRIPTDKGYRFFVDRVFAETAGEARDETDGAEVGDDEDPARYVQSIARELADVSSLFAAVFWKDLFWKEGWEAMFLQPEFKEQSNLLDFAKFVEDFQKNRERIDFEADIEVLIGRENTFSRVDGFSMMMAERVLPGTESMTIAILGPKRMAYDKNIRLLRSFINDIKHDVYE